MVFCGLVGTKGEWDNHSTPNGETVSLILDFRRFKVYIAVDPLALTARVRKWECCAKLLYLTHFETWMGYCTGYLEVKAVLIEVFGCEEAMLAFHLDELTAMIDLCGVLGNGILYELLVQPRDNWLSN
jgi:hypothetical protein